MKHLSEIIQTMGVRTLELSLVKWFKSTCVETQPFFSYQTASPMLNLKRRNICTTLLDFQRCI